MKQHTKIFSFAISSLMIVAMAAQIASAAVVPFTEDFDANSSNWFDANAAAPVDWQAAGGPDGSAYATDSFNPMNSVFEDTPVVFRAQDEFGSSGNAFVGNYLAEGVTTFTAFVRHDASFPINFFARFSSPFNFPGAVGVTFVPALPNVWTEITIDIQPGNPQFVTFEGSDFNTIFSNIGHVQIGPFVDMVAAGQDVDITFDLDMPSIVPEPTVGALLLIVVGCIAARRRRR